MYDLHAHILPGLDDGAKTVEDATAMAYAAVAGGTKAMLATPHMKDVSERSSVAYAKELLAEMVQLLESKGVGLTLLMGMENHLVPSLPEMFASGSALPINGSRYALVELPFFGRPNYLEETLFQLQVQGITPVLAHPERIEVVQQHPDLLVGLVERGMLSQITAGSLLGQFGPEVKRVTVDLLRRGLAHVIASDTHYATGPRSPELGPALEAAAKIVGPDRARAMMVDTPKAILDNLPIAPEPPLRGETPRRRWWRRL